MWSRVLLLAVCSTLILAQPAHAERRVALVIGNGAYKTAPLKNPTNDAQDMADALREMGFDVTLKLNASHKEMEQAVREFGAKLKQGGLGLFYYAGHGVQVAGENYLIPVDTKVEAEADVKFGALNAGMALARMEDAGNDFNIVILDACRTNPFVRSFRTADQGLARMDAPKGSLIAYATAPGRVAADSGGTGRNGVYTSFLLQHMRVPGLKVEEILKRVRADVVLATKDKQVPWESSSLIGDFYFVSSGQQVASFGQSVPSVQSSPPPVQSAPKPLDLKAEKKHLVDVSKGSTSKSYRVDVPPRASDEFILDSATERKIAYKNLQEAVSEIDSRKAADALEMARKSGINPVVAIVAPELFKKELRKVRGFEGLKQPPVTQAHQGNVKSQANVDRAFNALSLDERLQATLAVYMAEVRLNRLDAMIEGKGEFSTLTEIERLQAALAYKEASSKMSDSAHQQAMKDFLDLPDKDPGI